MSAQAALSSDGAASGLPLSPTLPLGASGLAPLLAALHVGALPRLSVLRLSRCALGDAGLLRCSDGRTDKRVRDCYALRSLPVPGVTDDARAARDGRQPAHSDSPEPPDGELSAIADDDFPLPLPLPLPSAAAPAATTALCPSTISQARRSARVLE